MNTIEDKNTAVPGNTGTSNNESNETANRHNGGHVKSGEKQKEHLISNADKSGAIVAPGKPGKENTETFKFGDWEAQSKQLKTKFSQLTDADLKYEPGKENELLSRIGNKLGKRRDELIDILKKGQPEKV